MKLRCLSALFLLLCSQSAESASILAAFSSLSFADHLVFRGYVNRLAQAGHSVVVMTPYPGRFTYPELERIVELNVGEESGIHWNAYKKLVTNTDDHYPKMRAMYELQLKIAISQLRSKQMHALLINPNVHFDLVVTEADVPVLYALADKYQAPHVAITATSGKINQYESKGCPIHPLMYPDVNSLKYGNLTIFEQFTEVSRFYHSRNEYYNSYIPLSQLAAEKLLGLKRSLLDVELTIDFLLVAANPILTGNRPVSPTVAYVDRLHIKPGLSLPQDLKNILDAAKSGVCYFSLGAIQDAEDLSTKMLQTLADGFKQLPFTILWKISNSSMIQLPGNVITRAWFPQQEVLAHPNVKVFLTHGGPRSLEEAIFYQVPIVGLPLVKSRNIFIKEITKYGAGEILDPYFLEKDAIIATISLVASNEEYKNAMTQLSKMVVDPLISGPDNSLWWTDFVLRQGGTKNIRSYTGVSFLKYYLLDTLLILLITSLAFLWISVRIIRYIIWRIRVRIFQNQNLGGKFKAL